jgi:hypothetical protein
VKAVAVVTLLTERVTVDRIGLTVFSNDKTSFDGVAQLNTLTEQIVAERLHNAKPAWEIKRVAYDRQDLISKLDALGMTMMFPEEKISRDLASIAKASGADVIFVVSEDSSRGVKGIDLRLHTSDSSTLRGATLFTNVVIAVANRDGKIIDRRWGASYAEKSLSAADLGFTYDLTPAHDPETQAKIREQVISQLKGSIAEGMQNLKL